MGILKEKQNHMRDLGIYYETNRFTIISITTTYREREREKERERVRDRAKIVKRFTTPTD